MNLWTNPTVVPKQCLMLGSGSSFQGTTQNLKMGKPLHARGWWLLHHWPKIIVSIVSPRTTYIRLEVSLPMEWTLCETCPWIRQISWSIDIPIIVDAAFLHNIQVCLRSVLETSYISVEQGMILFSASKVWLVVQRDGGIWSFPTWTKNRLSLHQHPELSPEVVEETLLILQENQGDLLLVLVAAVSRWMFSGPDLTQEVWFVHLRLEN